MRQVSWRGMVGNQMWAGATQKTWSGTSPCGCGKILPSETCLSPPPSSKSEPSFVLLQAQNIACIFFCETEEILNPPLCTTALLFTCGRCTDKHSITTQVTSPQWCTEEGASIRQQSLRHKQTHQRTGVNAETSSEAWAKKPHASNLGS